MPHEGVWDCAMVAGETIQRPGDGVLGRVTKGPPWQSVFIRFVASLATAAGRPNRAGPKSIIPRLSKTRSSAADPHGFSEFGECRYGAPRRRSLRQVAQSATQTRPPNCETRSRLSRNVSPCPGNTCPGSPHPAAVQQRPKLISVIPTPSSSGLSRGLLSRFAPADAITL